MMASLTRRRLIGVAAGAAVGLAAGWRAWIADQASVASPPIGTSAALPSASTAAPAPETSPPSSDGVSASQTPQPPPAEMPTTTTAPTATTSDPGFDAEVLVVIAREGWGAKPAVGEFVTHEISRITIHHTAANGDDVAAAPARMRSYQSFHQNDKGWEDLAYHFIIDGSGNIYEGRPVGAVGDTATSYDPTGHFLACLDGNFDEATPLDSQIASLTGLLAWASVEYGVDASTIAAHRDYAGTSCPGDNMYSKIESVRDGVEATVAAGGVGLHYLRAQAAVDRVESIETG